MNRKMRRSRPKKRKIIDYDLFLKKFTFLLESNVHEPLDQETIDSFQVPWEAALNSLRFGTAQDGDFEVLSIMLILGVELADIIGRYDKTGQITAAGNGYREYGKALYKIGVRHNNTAGMWPLGTSFICWPKQRISTCNCSLYQTNLTS